MVPLSCHLPLTPACGPPQPCVLWPAMSFSSVGHSRNACTQPVYYPWPARLPVPGIMSSTLNICSGHQLCVTQQFFFSLEPLILMESELLNAGISAHPIEGLNTSEECERAVVRSGWVSRPHLRWEHLFATISLRTSQTKALTDNGCNNISIQIHSHLYIADSPCDKALKNVSTLRMSFKRQKAFSSPNGSIAIPNVINDYSRGFYCQNETESQEGNVKSHPLDWVTP